MIEVSERWKELHRQSLLPETFVEIRLEQVDELAVDELSFDEENIAFGNPPDAINNNHPYFGGKRAWLEPNFWVLDGSMTIAPDLNSAYELPGIVGFQDFDPVLTIRLPAPRAYNLSGFTITWCSEYGDYATDFNIQVKNGETVVKSVDVSGNKSVISDVDLPGGENEYYDSVVVTVSGWKFPERRKRLETISFGRSLIFGKDEILSYSHEQTGDPTSSEVSKNEIQFSLDNSDDKWNPLNPEGFGRYLYEQQKLTVYYGLQVNHVTEWVQAGVFYLSEWSAPSNGLEARFTARDILGSMLNTKCNITSRKARVVRAENIFDSIDHATNIDNDPDTGAIIGVVGRTTVGEIVDIYEISLYYPFENQPTVYHGALMRIDRGWVYIYALDLTDSNTPMSETYEELSEQCSLPDEVTLRVEDTEFESLCPPLFINDTSLATYLQLCAGVCGSAVWQNHEGVLRFAEPSWGLTDYTISAGLSYSHPEVELAKPLKEIRFVGYFQGGNHTEDVVHSYGSTGEIVIVDNPYALHSLYFPDEATYSPAVVPMLGVGSIDRSLDSIARMWRNRGKVSGEFRADPRLELFDVVKVETKFGTLSPVMITRITYTYNGAFHGSYEGKVLYEEE